MDSQSNLHDSDIRDDLSDYLEEKYGKVRFFDELVIGKSRADIVMVTREAIVGVEIKSDADTYARLSRQVKDYDVYFDQNILVVGSTHAMHAKEHMVLRHPHQRRTCMASEHF